VKFIDNPLPYLRASVKFPYEEALYQLFISLPLPSGQHLPILPPVSGIICILCCGDTDVMGWPQSYCEYPRWLSRTVWLSLSGQNIFTIDNTSHVMRVGVRPADMTSQQPTVLKSLRCLRVVVERKSDAVSVFVALAFVSHIWYFYFNTLQLINNDALIRMSKGPMTRWTVAPPSERS